LFEPITWRGCLHAWGIAPTKKVLMKNNFFVSTKWHQITLSLPK
jgi:hypothetical protein